MDDASENIQLPVKRGRGRPRKTPLPMPEPPPVLAHVPEPFAPSTSYEELLMPNQTVDTSDLARAPPPSARAMPAEEDEIIRLSSAEDAPAGNGQAAVAPTPAYHATAYVSPSPPAEDKARRNNVLTKLRKYRASFEAVRLMKFDENWTVEKLEEHLEDVRLIVSSKTTGVIIKNVYLGGVKALEVASCAAHMKTYGLTQLVSQNAEINSILLELQAEIGIGHVPPGHRLAIATIGACIALDSAQRKAEILAGFKKEQVNPDLSAKFGDL